MKEKDLLKLSPGEITDLGVCPTCLNRKYGGAIYGDDTDKVVYRDEDVECFFAGNPRAKGHMCISTQTHYQDMSEAPDYINEKIVRLSKQLMKIIKEVYGCERVYLCTMCDGPCNHYHVQLIPRYFYEKRGSTNFVKPREDYVFDSEKFQGVRKRLLEYIDKASKE